MAREYAVLTAMGPDKPGLVDALSQFLLDADANLEDSRMAVLGDAFAVILLASGETGLRAKLSPGMPAIEKATGLRLALEAAQTPNRSRPAVPCEIRAVALDHPGIVHAIAHVVAQRGANVESLDSACSPAPVTGSPLFTLRMTCTLPEDLRFTQFRDAVESAATDMGFDVQVRLLGA